MGFISTNFAMNNEETNILCKNVALSPDQENFC